MLPRPAVICLCITLMLGFACSSRPGKAQGPRPPDMPSPEKSAEDLNTEIQKRLDLDETCMKAVRPAITDFFLDRQALLENMMGGRDREKPDFDAFDRKMEHVVDDAMSRMESVLDADQRKTVRYLLAKNAAPQFQPPQGGSPGGRGGKRGMLRGRF